MTAHPHDGMVPASTSLRRGAPVVLLVVIATAIVAMGATGIGLIVPRASLSPSRVVFVRIAGALVAAAGVAGLLAQRDRLHSDARRGPDPTFSALVVAGLLMIALALLSLLAPVRPTFEATSGSRIVELADRINEEAGRSSARSSRPSTGGLNEGFGQSELRRNGDRTSSPGASALQDSLANASGSSGPGLLGRFLPLVLLAVALLGVVLLRRRLRPALPLRARAVVVAAAEAEAGLQASLGEVSYEGSDPRGQITAAYHRLLVALAAAGAPRKPQEAPHEYLFRALGPLGVRPEPMHRLAELYVVAQFSDREIAERHRAAAAEALELALASLRSRADSTLTGFVPEPAGQA